VGLGRGVEIAEQRPGLDTDHPPVRVHVAASQRREVDHDPVVTHGVAGNVVPPALDRNHKILPAPKLTAAITSVTFEHLAMRAGRRLTMPFQRERAAM